MTLIVCVVCGHKVDPPGFDCPKCERDGQRRFKGALVVGVELSREWVDPTIH